jgi:hypothetical protein
MALNPLKITTGFGNTVFDGNIPHLLRRGFGQIVIAPTDRMSFQFPGIETVFFERGRTYVITEPILAYQRRFEDEGLKSKVISYAAQSGMIQFNLEGISKNNVNQINAFFANPLMNYSQQLFFFTNEDLKIFEVYLWQDSIVSRETSPNRFNVSMTFKNMGELA